MIYRMTLIILQFFVLLIVGLITFASIATMTLSEIDAFKDMYEATRVYLNAALGSFDLYQYDDLGGWKQYYGYFLHVAVLFFFLILLLNLLIAIMSDEYAVLANHKTGLYWSNVILEMPKFKFSKYYGALTMQPFLFAWMGLLVAPCLRMSKSRYGLPSINRFIFVVNYVPIFLLTLVLFVTVNLLLLPLAYFKTIYHKYTLLKLYRGGYQCQSLVFFVILGIPILLCAQFIDIYYFLVHSFGFKGIDQAVDNRNKTKFSYDEFKKLFRHVNDKIKMGQDTVNAVEFVLELREKE